MGKTSGWLQLASLLVLVVAFVVAWSLLLTTAQNRSDFPESAYSLAIIGPLLGLIGEIAITAFLAFLAVAAIAGYSLLFLSRPTAIVEIAKRLLDISTGSVNALGDRESELRERLSKVESEIEAGLLSDQLDEVGRRVTAALSENNGRAIIAYIESRFSKAIEDSAKVQMVEEAVGQVYRDLASERQTVSFRSGFNLMIGMALGVAGVLILYLTLLRGDVVPSAESTLMYYISRITLSVLFQALAFFFLSLYRSGLQDVKYFRNEMTNVGLLRLAIKLAQANNNTDVIPAIVSRLASTERNFVLRKGETATKSETESSVMDEKTIGLIDKLLDIVKSFNKQA